MSRTNFHGPKDVRAIKVPLYIWTGPWALNAQLKGFDIFGTIYAICEKEYNFCDRLFTFLHA